MKRQLLLLPLFLSLWLNSFSQIPKIRTNVTDDTKSKSLINNAITKDFDFVLACTASSYWSSKNIFYQGLALKGDTWKKFSLTVKRKKTGKLTRPKIHYRPFKREIAKN
jgi:hypothetical protein